MSRSSSSSIAAGVHALAVSLLLVLGACSSGPEPRPTPVSPVAEPAPEGDPAPRVPLGPVPHDGPLVPDPAFYDCGQVETYDRCEFGVVLTHGAAAPLSIEDIAQDFAVSARVGLVDDGTGLTRDLPHVMPRGERLRLLFSYRCEEPQAEQVGGSMFVTYEHDGRRYRLEVPIGCH